MRPTFFRWLLATTLAFVLTSCFDISEEITLNKNDSGTYRFKLDMSQLIAMGEALKEATDSTEEKAPDQADKLFEDSDGMLDGLKGVRGISGVTNLSDEDKGILEYQFDFKDVDALNQAFRAMSKKSKTPLEQDVFEHKRGKLTRLPAEGFIVDSILGNAQEQAEGEEEDEATAQMVMQMFSSGNYTLKIRVPRKVKAFDNERGEIRNKNEVYMQVALNEMMQHSEYLNYTLNYK